MDIKTQKNTEYKLDGSVQHRVKIQSNGIRKPGKNLSTTELVSAVLSYRPKEITYGKRLVLITIANHYNSKTGQCNPTWRTVSNITGFDRSTIHRAITKANELGILSWVGLSYRGNNPHNSYCWQGLCPTAKPAWKGRSFNDEDNFGDYQIVSRSQRISPQERKESLIRFQKILNSEDNLDANKDFQDNPEIFSALSKLTEVDREAMLTFIRYRKLSEDAALLELEKAAHYQNMMYSPRDESGEELTGTPIQCLIADAIDRNFRQLNWEWRVDYNSRSYENKFVIEGQ